MRRAGVRALALVVILTALIAAPARALVYTNISDIKVATLRNGVQITVVADGILQFERQFGGRQVSIDSSGNVTVIQGGAGGGDANSPGRTFRVLFPGARNATGKSFINVGEFPVSHIQLAIPEGAEEGVGVAMTVTLFEPSQVSMSPSEDQTSAIITVQTNRTIERRGGGRPGGPERTAPIPEMTVEAHEGLVTVRAVKTSIHRVVSELARVTGLSITVDDRVQREVSLSVDGMPAPDLLRALANSYGLALLEEHGVFMFAEGVPTDLATYSLTDTASIRMTNVRAQVASSLLPNFLFSYIHVNPEQNAVVVTAPADMLAKVRSDLEAIDNPAPEIMIDALAVEFSKEDDLEYALHTEAHSPQSLIAVDSATGQISYRNIGTLPRDFIQRLRFLETERHAQVRSNPRMAALNGRDANLFIGAQRFIRVLVTIGGGIQQEQIQAVDVGVRLTITPWTGGGDEITSSVQIEVSNIRDLDPVTGLPVLSTRRVRTTIRLRDGETLMIGGLTQKSKFTTVRKVPLLGDLPLLGPLLFRSRSTSDIDSDLTIFLTPRLLGPGGHLKNADEEEKIRQKFLNEGQPSGAPAAAPPQSGGPH